MSLAEPVVTEIIGNQLLSVTEEMTAMLIRSSYSANIKERWDCSSAVLSPHGEVVAQTAHSPVHLGGMQGAVRALVRNWESLDPGPDDVFVSNDPYLASAVHLNDVTVAAPAFASGTLIGFVATVAHHADLGGRVPGGEAKDSRHIFEEGLRIPPTRLVTRGVPVASLMDVLYANSRNPREILGDFRAQISAVQLGIRRTLETIDKWGSDALERTLARLLDVSEAKFRAAVERLPDGRYEATDWADDDWVTGKPFAVHVGVEISGSGVVVDLRDNVDQLESSRNVSSGMLTATILTALKSVIDPYSPPNSALGRAVTVRTRQGSVFAPQPPAAVGLGPRTCQILFGALYAALSQVLPDRVCAGSATAAGIQVFGVNPRTGAPYLNYERVGGGFGARQMKDGLDGVQFGVTNTSNLPIEASEAEYPFLVEAYEIIPDSGGPGQYRGGLGVRRDIRVLAPNGATLTAQGERIVHPPPGLHGGLPGAAGRMVLNPGTENERDLPTAFVNLKLAEGDVIGLRTAGGGGFGDPGDRDRTLIEDDIRTGRVSAEAARREYGYSG
jgi:N-methylhydantoinase B